MGMYRISRIITTRHIRAISVLATIISTVDAPDANADALAFRRETAQSYPSINRFTRLEVYGPLHVKVSLEEDFNRCNQAAIFGDKELLKYVVVESKGETLRISMPDRIIPKHWMYASLECESLRHVQVERFSSVSVYNMDIEEFQLSVDGGTGSLSGEIENIDAVVRNGGFITLAIAKIKSADLQAKSGGVVHAKVIEAYSAKTEEKGEIHFFVTNHKRNHKEEISPGVYLRSKNIMMPHDASVAYDADDYEKVKEKMEREWMNK